MKNTDLILSSIPFNELMTAISETVKIQFERQNNLSTPSRFQKEYLSRSEAAKTLNISLPTLSKHSKSGLIKSHRIGGRVVYKSAELNEALSMVQTSKTGS